MVKKTNTLALEHTKNLEVKLTILNPRLTLEAIKFIKRNNLNENHNVCCKNCLKAHLLRKARSFKIKINTSTLNDLLAGEIGHQGYYLDKERLFKI